MGRGFERRGAWTALITPFSERGELDPKDLARLVEFQVSQGIDGVVPCGTTGESPTLSWQEHGNVVEQTIHRVNGRVGVLAGAGSNNTREAVRSGKHAQAAGADAILLVDCYYNGPSSAELRDHYYDAVLEAVPDVPVVPYVIPGRSGCALDPADVALLHGRYGERLPAVKEATGDLERMARERDLCGDGFGILSGDDDLTFTMITDESVRANGAISVMSNLVPGAVSRMVTHALAGEREPARRICDQLAPLFSLVGCTVNNTRTLADGRAVQVTDRYRNPAPVKTMMAALGMCAPHLRAPLGWMHRDAVNLCRTALRKVHAHSPEVLQPVEAHFGVNIQGRLDDDEAWNSVVS